MSGQYFVSPCMTPTHVIYCVGRVFIAQASVEEFTKCKIAGWQRRKNKTDRVSSVVVTCARNLPTLGWKATLRLRWPWTRLPSSSSSSSSRSPAVVSLRPPFRPTERVVISNSRLRPQAGCCNNGSISPGLPKRCVGQMSETVPWTANAST